MLNYLLDELIPWLDYQKYDLRTLEVNKYVYTYSYTVLIIIIIVS